MDNNTLLAYLNTFSTLKINITDKKILHVQLNRPRQLNALNEELFEELGKLFCDFTKFTDEHDIRAVILSGNGKAFSTGLDLKSKFAVSMLDFKNEPGDIGRRAFSFYKTLKKLQENLTAIENCPVPVIASVHGFCLGGAVSILTCADVRIASSDSKFSIKEIDIGLTADLGAIQRLIKQNGKEGLIKKYCFTGEIFSSMQALNIGMIEEIVESAEDGLKRSFELAEIITTKSPLVLWGIKRSIHFARDNNLETSLDMIATLNSALIQTDDISLAIEAFMTKKKPNFPKL